MRGTRNFCRGGGGGVQARRPENSLDIVFSVLSLFYSLQRGSKDFIAEKIIFSQESRGGQHFSGGGGVQMLISIETHITCDFPGGGGSGPPIPSGFAHTEGLPSTMPAQLSNGNRCLIFG